MRSRVGSSIVRELAGALVLTVLALFVLVSCATSAKPSHGTGGTGEGATVAGAAATGSQALIDAGYPVAPPFPKGLDWLNTATPLTLTELRGKFVLLDFWTYGCINCMHDIPWIKKIERDYPNILVVIGVHSAKFTHSGITKNIREVILRYGLDYPVVNDDHFQIWKEYGVNAWPTLALIDPQGRVVAGHVGEGFYQGFKQKITSLESQFAARGLLDRTPLKLKLAKQGLPQTVLSFPGKVRVDAKRNRIFIVDTGHNRIVEARLDSGEVISVIGNGTQGLKNGGYSNAEFSQPQGVACSSDGELLYVADTGNSDIRLVNLKTHQVSTLVGTGQQAQAYPPSAGIAPDVALSSPWDLALGGDILYIAMAGSHQIWTMNLSTKWVKPFAGSGAEGASDGSLADATLAQPSGLGLSADGTRLYFANSESSSIRYVDFKDRRVVTLAGPTDNLFDFGNRNGIGQFARFQHPLGIVSYKGVVYVADTYNSEIKAINPVSGAVKTLEGGPGSGWRDGKNPLFYEASGLDAAGGKLYVADTNNHSIRTVDLSTGMTSTFVLKGMEKLSGPHNIYGEKTVELSPLSVSAGEGLIKLVVSFPDGYEPNAQAPSDIQVSSSAESVISLKGKKKFSGAGPKFPMQFVADFNPGTARLVINLSVVYCQDQKASVCLIHQAKLDVPVTVKKGAAQTGGTLTVSYHVE